MKNKSKILMFLWLFISILNVAFLVNSIIIKEDMIWYFINGTAILGGFIGFLSYFYEFRDNNTVKQKN